MIHVNMFKHSREVLHMSRTRKQVSDTGPRRCQKRGIFLKQS